jgi:hypothetical protein
VDDFDRQRLALYVERIHGTADFEVLAAASMLWSGWECDTAAALVRLGDGQRVWAVLDAVNVASADVPRMLRERIKAYRQAIFETEALLAVAGEI